MTDIPTDLTDMKYILKGNRQGFEILPADEVRHLPDGYTEVRRNGVVVGVYVTALLRHENLTEGE